MAGDSSFDVVSDFDQQELVNALDQTRREIATRYDFKGSKVAFDLGKDAITLTADDEYRAGAVRLTINGIGLGAMGGNSAVIEWRIARSGD